MTDTVDAMEPSSMEKILATPSKSQLKSFEKIATICGKICQFIWNISTTITSWCLTYGKPMMSYVS
jgi:hypothetical protein